MEIVTSSQKHADVTLGTLVPCATSTPARKIVSATVSRTNAPVSAAIEDCSGLMPVLRSMSGVANQRHVLRTLAGSVPECLVNVMLGLLAT